MSDPTAKVWHADGSGVPVELRGHEFQLFDANFSPDGARIVTASLDSTARVWFPDLPRALWKATPFCLSKEDRIDLLDQDEAVAVRDLESCKRMVTCLQQLGEDGYAECHREFRRSQERRDRPDSDESAPAAGSRPD